MEKGLIIVLNGVSSSGKSSLAHELTKLLPDFFTFSIDNYDIVIDKMEDRENERLIPIETEYFYHKNVAMFADRGVNLILDQIIHDTKTMHTFYETLSEYTILFVGVHCSPEELTRRELLRGDRHIGLAISQLEFVHKQEVYDIEVNTEQQPLSVCANLIVNRLNNAVPFTGFRQSLANNNKNAKLL
ncbi:chloramphenicol phosphotransferase CPT family protein [Ureibacillus acetophenoni]|uniref:Chloramphenicol 3-O phosphotransferase n=1 Tax=Ureibacillus acetophenoni TaxID=614649 RepID=A0A285UP99_9BACL|nr:AAA family ATPase [Ureibacillus acetophenoni]SOC43228.1 chloramphenicol 3-O phosphotransferase [Ureibacillus acetophenoni]